MSFGIKPREIVWEDEGSDEAAKEDRSELDALMNDHRFSYESLRIGNKIEATLTTIPETGDALLDLKNGRTAFMERDQLLDEDEGTLKYSVGDRISAYVVGNDSSGIQLSLRMGKSHRAIEDLQTAQSNKLPVKGKVVKEINGGFEVTVFGKRAFCPFSGMSLKFVANKTQFIGQDFDFLIEKIEAGGRNLVVTRKPLLEAEATERLSKLKGMQSGESPILNGVVTDIRDYGAFVDIGGGTEGFVHISELSHSRVSNIKDFLRVGEQVKVKVLGIDEEAGKKPRISLSLKAALDDPWADIQQKLKMGETYKARVTRIEKFGAFVAVESGIEGLIPISEMSWTKRLNHPSEILSIDQLVTVRVLNINTAERKLSFSLKDMNADPWFEIEKKFPIGSHQRGKVTHLKSHGALVNFAEGLSGLIPMSTLKAAYGVGYRKHASPPKEIEVSIAKIEKELRRILLNIWNFESPEDEDSNFDAMTTIAERATAQGTGADDNKKIGTLGLLLAKKMEKKV